MKTTISKLDIIKAPAGHQTRPSGCGVHRDYKKQPKGGRNAQQRKAIREW